MVSFEVEVEVEVEVEAVVVVDHPSKARCPATGKMCNYCHNQGHFIKMCCKRLSKEAGEVEQAPDIGQDESKPFYVQEVTVSCSDGQDVWTTELRVGGTNVTFKTD